MEEKNVGERIYTSSSKSFRKKLTECSNNKKRFSGTSSPLFDLKCSGSEINNI